MITGGKRFVFAIRFGKDQFRNTVEEVMCESDEKRRMLFVLFWLERGEKVLKMIEFDLLKKRR